MRLFWWTVFAAAFGFTEAATVVYIRRVTGMAPGLDYGDIMAARNVALHPLDIAEEMRRQGVYGVEISREIATLLLLLGAAWAAGRTQRERCGLFGYAFAVWDLTYYLWLALLIGFPHSLTAIDIYFLLPVPSYGPVWFPVLIVMPALIALSLRLLQTTKPPETQAHRRQEQAPG